MDSKVYSRQMKAAQHGLFVKATSGPDLGVLISTARDENGNVTDTDISLGEIKNDDSYCTKDALEQEVCYLMLLKYWWDLWPCGGRNLWFRSMRPQMLRYEGPGAQLAWRCCEICKFVSLNYLRL